MKRKKKKLKRRKANKPPVGWKRSHVKLLLNYLRTKKFNAKKLKKLFPNRSLPSLRSKVRKLRIQYDLFGNLYRPAKEKFTIEVASQVKPKVVFDAYAGAGHQTFKWIEVANTVYASEVMKGKLKQFDKVAESSSFKKYAGPKKNWFTYKKGKKSIHLFNGDALDAAVHIKMKAIKVNLVDFDTCGSTLPLLPTILLLTKPQNIVITHGEFHSMRFKREDVLRRLFVHRDIRQNPLPLKVDQMGKELDKAVKLAALRAHNETTDSFWLKLKKQVWLGGKFHGMLRRHYSVSRPKATADCINEISTAKNSKVQFA